MITVNNISKSFADKQVLYDINVEFETGKTNMLIGASGTGKSVLLKCIVGLIIPDSGTVEFNGRSFANASKELQTEVRREMGMLLAIVTFSSANVELRDRAFE